MIATLEELYRHNEMFNGCDYYGPVRLTANRVRTIRAEAAAGVSIKSLADRFEISETEIEEVVARKSWVHIK